MQKPIILLIIDTLMTKPLEEAVQTGYAPTLQFLMEKGRYFPNVVSSFPTMSVTIDSTLLTGEYSDKHRIPALIWYDENDNRVVNYGTGIREIIQTGFRRFVKDMYYELNNVHLSKNVKTIYEELADRGLESASVNAFVYRGRSKKELKLPGVLRVFTGFYKPWQVQAPSLLSLGDFSKFSPFTLTPQPFSLNYKAAFRELKFLIKKQVLPSFTFCVIQDLDLKVHLKGPMDLTGISKIDDQLKEVFNLFPSWNEAIEQCIWIVMADNGHASMGNNRGTTVIELREVLRDFSISKNDTEPQASDQLLICVNQRTAFVYCLSDFVNKTKVIDQLKGDNRIDIIAWNEDGKYHVVSGEKGGKLSFWPDGDNTDHYNQRWGIIGDEKILDLTIQKEKISYGDYPDALARLSSSLHSHKGKYLVITAKPGYEFKESVSPTHVGGAAHGSLHKQESLVPMIVAGTNSYPQYERIVDLKPWILSLILD